MTTRLPMQHGQHFLEPQAFGPSPEREGFDHADLCGQFVGGRYLKTADAARAYGYRAVSGFREWALGAGIAPIRRGRVLLWDVRDCNRAIEASRVVRHAVQRRRSAA